MSLQDQLLKAGLVDKKKASKAKKQKHKQSKVKQKNKIEAVDEAKVAAEKVGVALTHFNTKSMAEMPLPVPPLQEQEILVELVDQKLSDVEKLDAVIDEQLIKSERNKQAVLASAFSGKLN